MYAAMDGEGSTQEDLKAASSALAAGTAQLESSLESLSGLASQVNGLAQTGSELITEGKELSGAVDSSIKAPGSTADGRRTVTGSTASDNPHYPYYFTDTGTDCDRNSNGHIRSECQCTDCRPQQQTRCSKNPL